MTIFTTKLIYLGLLTGSRAHVTKSYINVPRIWKQPHRSKIGIDWFYKSEAQELMEVQVVVLGSGAAGVPGNVILVVNGRRYLINCGEGTQKLGNEYRLSLGKIRDVFITYSSWRNIAGLPGLSLTLDKSKSFKLNVYGHKCIETLFTNGCKFAVLRNVSMNFNKCNHYGKFSDGFLTGKFVYLYPSGYEGIKKNLSDSDLFEDSEAESGPSTESNELEHNILKHPKSHLVGKVIQERNLKYNKARSQSEDVRKTIVELEKPSMCFIFKTPKIDGTLLPKKCFQLGVPAGPLLGCLKRGENITLENGTVVKSEDVKGPDLPGLTIIALECPSEKYLDALLTEQAVSEYQSEENAAALVIHFSKYKIIKNPKYQKWINAFPKETKHLFLNENNILSGSVGVQRQQFKLNFLSPKLFPLLCDSKIPNFPRAEHCILEEGHQLIDSELKDKNLPHVLHSDKTFYKCVSNSFINGETLCQIYLRPKKEYDYSKCLVLRKNEFLNEMFANGMKDKIKDSKIQLESLQKDLEKDNRVYPKVIFLGTGSSKPGKVRNASGILIEVEENKSILLDCGENTYSQIIYFYGGKKTEKILRTLKAIYVSHLHVDHHLGLIRLLKEKKHAIDKMNKEKSTTSKNMNFEPVYLLAPVQIQRLLLLYSSVIENISELYTLIPNTCFLEKRKNETSETKNCMKDLNLSQILTTLVCHCPNAFGISMTHKDGWKLTYSGDTKPCDDLVKIGMNSDILIHEATFEDAFCREARIKLHCTTSQAIDIGQKMKAKFILLTHFSQRYCVIPVIEERFKELNIGIAFDFMEIPFNLMPLLSQLLEPLQYIFSQYDEKIKSQLLFSKRLLEKTEISSDVNDSDIKEPATKKLKTLLQN